MINANQIKPNTPIVCSENGQFGVVDHMEGADTIKVTKDKQGQHHYFPLAWVTKVDDKIHVDRPGKKAQLDWSTTPPNTKDSATNMPDVLEATDGINAANRTDAMDGRQPSSPAIGNDQANGRNKSNDRSNATDKSKS